MKSIEVRKFDSPDEVRNFDKGKLELINVNGRIVGRATFEPGWRWSHSLKPVVKTESCQAPHFQYHVSGTLHIKADDGTERDVKAGEVSLLGAGHDAWVVGNEPVVVIDFQGMADYAQQRCEPGSEPLHVYKPD
ncbi:MAG TPA: cupin domain-containing protein [Syntrophorhabdales bacterium]|nr:cupin domain-containing protein [Syntrophorhabdales bacterium]